jgi:uncharacterized protein (UPF0305 family)
VLQEEGRAMEIVYNHKDPLIQSLRDRKLDEFLDIYSFYLLTRVDDIRNEAMQKAKDVAELDPKFQFFIREVA